MAKEKKQPKKKISFFTKVAFFVFFSFCAITIIRLRGEIVNYQNQIAAADEQIDFYTGRIEALNEELIAQHLHAKYPGQWEPTDQWNNEWANDREWS